MEVHLGVRRNRGDGAHNPAQGRFSACCAGWAQRGVQTYLAVELLRGLEPGQILRLCPRGEVPVHVLEKAIRIQPTVAQDLPRDDLAENTAFGPVERALEAVFDSLGSSIVGDRRVREQRVAQRIGARTRLPVLGCNANRICGTNAARCDGSSSKDDAGLLAEREVPKRLTSGHVRALHEVGNSADCLHCTPHRGECC
jgi:hypothetical protein